MLPISRVINEIRPHFASDADLLRTVMNSMSWVEATLAASLAAETVPAKQLVNVINVREALKELPRCPLAMPVDFETLARIWDMTRDGHGWERTVADPAGDYTVILLGEGNFCYDIVIRTDGRAYMWMPRDVEEDFVNPAVVDLIVERTTLLASIIDLAEAMGLVFSPLFYLSLEDWSQEYASTVFNEAAKWFESEDDIPAAPRRAVFLWDAEASFHRREERSIRYLG